MIFCILRNQNRNLFWPYTKLCIIVTGNVIGMQLCMVYVCVRFPDVHLVKYNYIFVACSGFRIYCMYSVLMNNITYTYCWLISYRGIFTVCLWMCFINRCSVNLRCFLFPKLCLNRKENNTKYHTGQMFYL